MGLLSPESCFGGGGARGGTWDTLIYKHFTCSKDTETKRERKQGTRCTTRKGPCKVVLRGEREGREREGGARERERKKSKRGGSLSNGNREKLGPKTEKYYLPTLLPHAFH